MSSFDSLIHNLVIANRILAKEDVVDAYGHVSVRHPDDPGHFLIARSLAPELVGEEDIVESSSTASRCATTAARSISSASSTARSSRRGPTSWRVVHAHAEDVLPFSIAAAPLRPVIHAGSLSAHSAGVGHRRQVRRHQPPGDQHRAGPRPRRMPRRRRVVLMRGHGFAAAGALADRGRAPVRLRAAQRAGADRAIRLGGAIKTRRGRDRARNGGYRPYSPETGAPGNIGRTRPAAATS